jgi:uncharacterized protein YjbI with pentapeptide repeats
LQRDWTRAYLHGNKERIRVIEKRDRESQLWLLEIMLAMLKSGVQNWNKWREENKAAQPDLKNAHLPEVNLRGVNLVKANLGGANLGGGKLGGAYLQGANLGEANLGGADLSSADLRGADLGKVKSFYKAMFNPEILAQVKANWPEKLATIQNASTGEWFVDIKLHEQIKQPDWPGWLKEENQGK